MLNKGTFREKGKYIWMLAIMQNNPSRYENFKMV